MGVMFIISVMYVNVFNESSIRYAYYECNVWNRCNACNVCNAYNACNLCRVCYAFDLSYLCNKFIFYPNMI